MTIETRITDRLRPAIINHNNYILHQYRGLQYGRVPRRFSEPEAVAIDNLLLQPDCTQFGYANFLFIHPTISTTDEDFTDPSVLRFLLIFTTCYAFQNHSRAQNNDPDMMNLHVSTWTSQYQRQLRRNYQSSSGSMVSHCVQTDDHEDE